MARNKKPKTAFTPSGAKSPRAAHLPNEAEKIPRIVAPPMVYSEKPSWRLKTLDLGGPWCWRGMGAVDLERVLARLQSLETMTWGAVFQDGGKENHAIDISRLSSEAQKRLRTIKLDDVDDVISLRITGRERVIGVRYGSVLRLLWWDPRHEVCPSVKKHT